jgi:RHH-type rel operon transcriptional repressor/antitoxin RelB
MATTIELSTEVERRLASLADRTGRTKDYYVQQIISRGLEEVEDYYLAIKVLERVRQGEETVFSSAEVRKRLGLED